MQGREAAEQFYHPGRFTRKGALPLFTLTLIQDLGSVMVLDGDEHRRRKAMFLAMMSRQQLERLSELTAQYWRKYARGRQGSKRVILFREAHAPFCAAVCKWARLQLCERDVRRRAREFEAMVEGTGTAGPRNWFGHLMRHRTERWMCKVITGIRTGKISPPAGSPAHSISTFRYGDGKLLDVKVAAVELINVLRPTLYR